MRDFLTVAEREQISLYLEKWKTITISSGKTGIIKVPFPFVAVDSPLACLFASILQNKIVIPPLIGHFSKYTAAIKRFNLGYTSEDYPRVTDEVSVSISSFITELFYREIELEICRPIKELILMKLDHVIYS